MNTKLIFGALLVMAALLVMPAMAGTTASAAAVGIVPTTLSLSGSGSIPDQTFFTGDNMFASSTFAVTSAGNGGYKIRVTDSMLDTKLYRGKMQKWSGTAYIDDQLTNDFYVKNKDGTWGDVTTTDGAIVKQITSGGGGTYTQYYKQTVTAGDPAASYRITLLYEIEAL
jgi:hypothetical protein